MKICIAGGTGFVGDAIIHELQKSYCQIYVLTRSPEKYESTKNLAYIKWMSEGSAPEKELEGIDVFINLAGESISSGRWSEERKKKIISSRLETTQEIIRIIGSLTKKPATFINASAIGFYGTSTDKLFTESEYHPGNDFLANTVYQWEKEALKAEKIGVRTVLVRFGIILGKEEGALPRMVLPYRLFAGGRIGSGRQWMSWIHIDDVSRAIIHCIQTNELSGPVNFTAPKPVQMEEFGRTIAQVLHKPHWIPVPGFVLKAVLGEISILILEGQAVLPKKLMETNYTFLWPHLKDALDDLF
ncbi:TIGR01777 family protein [Peribacillus saganii]|uniref:TIGR01777 family protein n=1 Tax=Peribacillus saganii TaxID=2303992 RepID=A0A372LM38_9BACI|nr:TIGR01777 family oxidoreductase [Peribacillus saganii]RFU68152.1 TIGR01777 family protein [Peribacillus saganii]